MGVEPAMLDRAAATAAGSLVRARLALDPDVAAFHGRLVELLATRPLRGVELSREVLAFVEAAGKDAPPRRARLRTALEAALGVFRDAARRTAGAAGHHADHAAAVQAWTGQPDRVAAAATCTLDALEAVDRNANLGVLIDAWTAVLEEPRLAGSR